MRELRWERGEGRGEDGHSVWLRFDPYLLIYALVVVCYSS